ncbi:hypothetical protein AB0E63_15930 [Kribbella sp. NPDC026596]|uniref:hypothetical protein n=1 Tax=Kribbella sp. NPDC026596 TaxID=3155122 RepID=UPI0033F1965B
MRVLAWLAFPLVATLLAMCWAAWRGRSRGPRRSGGAFASVEDFRRFNEALAAPGPSATRERRRGFGRRTTAIVSSAAGIHKSADEAAPAADGSGTDPGAGTLDPAQALARKLGPAEMFGSTKIAGQGS